MTNKEIVKRAIQNYDKSFDTSPFIAYKNRGSKAKNDAFQKILLKFVCEKQGLSNWDYHQPKICSYNSQTFTVGYWLNVNDYEKTEFVYITKTFEYRYKPAYDKVIKIKR